MIVSKIKYFLSNHNIVLTNALHSDILAYMQNQQHIQINTINYSHILMGVLLCE